MPTRMIPQHFEIETNPDLPLFEKPEDLPTHVEQLETFFGGPKQVFARQQGGYFCPVCNGWIPCDPYRHEVNTLAPLAGRKGTEFYCRRCGGEIGFSGVMS